MPTHSGYDQTSKAHESRVVNDSFKRRKPDTYARLDTSLQQAGQRLRRRRYILWLALLVATVGVLATVIPMANANPAY